MTDVDNFLAHHGIMGQKWGHRKGTPSDLIRKIPRSQLDRKNPEHLSELHRRNQREKVILGAAGVGFYAVAKTAEYAAGKSYARNLAKQAADIHKIPDSRAIHDGAVFALRLLANGSYGA